MKHITIEDAPAVLNTNDKAMWVLGYNEGIDALRTRLAEVSVDREEALKDRVALARENAALRAELAARWLPIESARPEYDTLVIVTWDNRDWEIRLCQITYDADGWLWADEYGELCEWGSDEMPTHWMPAPGAKE